MVRTRARYADLLLPATFEEPRALSWHGAAPGAGPQAHDRTQFHSNQIS